MTRNRNTFRLKQTWFNAIVTVFVVCSWLAVATICLAEETISDAQTLMREINRKKSAGQTDAAYLRLLLNATENLDLYRNQPQYVAEARNLLPKYFTPLLEADFYYVAALMAREENRVQNASDTFRLAIDRYIALGEKWKMALAYSRLGLLYHRLGQYESAIEYHVTALFLAQKNNFHDLIFRQNVNLAHLYTILNRPQKALELLRSAESFMREDEIPQRKMLFYRYKAEALTATNNLDSANLYVGRALRLPRTSEVNNTLNIAFLYGDAACIFQKKRLTEKASQMLDSLKHIQSSLPSAVDKIRLFLDAARVMMLRAEQSQDKQVRRKLFAETLAFTLESGAQPTDVRLYRLQVVEILSKCYSELGDFRSSFLRQKEYLLLRDSLFNTGLEARISSVWERLERNSHEEEIKVLRAENESKNKVQYALLLAAAFFAALVLVLWNRFRFKKRAKMALEALNRELQQKNIELHQTNATLHRTNEELTVAQEQAGEVNRIKREFIDVLSHEIRTPLTAVQGYAELLIFELHDAGHKEFAERIQVNARHLLMLFEDMLHLAKTRSDKIVLELQPTSLHDICRQVVAIFEANAQEKNIALSVEISSQLISHVMLDAAKLRLVLFNLLGNAIKFTNEGFVKLSVEIADMASVLNRLTRKDGDNNNSAALKECAEWIVLSVQDSGIGMNEDEVNTIFDAFLRTKNMGDKQVHGLGLGLTVCKAFVETMNGNIKVKSAKNKGSVFTVFLPLLQTPGSEVEGKRISLS